MANFLLSYSGRGLYGDILPVETVLGGHSVREHVQADWTGQLALQGSSRDGYLSVVGDDLLRSPVQLIKAQVP